ncbi:hypothetical protein Bcep1808_7675 (plasmid) [Burkholderia vietnamiensis G4]|uniref:Uncharacterized protein n=1 Tax=Burkholderia vietnamiensis (strain G4 / LMG 22486) TaxID=269482 RepID=A4JW92_BURVG|nr:hypothetical protein Bcep1808_7675 [Burkholderia vietnamiensis G4]
MRTSIVSPSSFAAESLLYALTQINARGQNKKTSYVWKTTAAFFARRQLQLTRLMRGSSRGAKVEAGIAEIPDCRAKPVAFLDWE